MPHQGIPAFDDIEQLALSEPILHRCYIHLRRGDITLDEFYRMCIVAYVEVNQKLRDELLLWFERSPTLLSFAHRERPHCG